MKPQAHPSMRRWWTRARVEVVVLLEGIEPSTGNTLQDAKGDPKLTAERFPRLSVAAGHSLVELAPSAASTRLTSYLPT